MGMYNEVFKTCPHCNGRGYLQIHQIVLGFGGFHLDNPHDIADRLSLDQVKELRDAVKDEWFVCEDCTTSFKLNEGSDNDEKMKILNSINEISEEDT